MANISPMIIAGTIAGGGIGMAAGAMSRGERSEERGDGGWQQLGQFAYGGLTGGAIGMGAGAGVGGALMLAKNVIRK